MTTDKKIVAILVVLAILYLIYLLKNKKPNYSSYRKGQLLKYPNIWYWKWDKNNNVTSLYSRCTKCNEVLVYDDSTTFNKIHFYCPHCNSQEMMIDGQTYSDLLSILRSEIKRNAYMKFNLKKK